MDPGVARQDLVMETLSNMCRVWCGGIFSEVLKCRLQMVLCVGTNIRS